MPQIRVMELEETSGGHLTHPPCSSRVTESRLSRTMSRRFLGISKGEDSTTPSLTKMMKKIGPRVWSSMAAAAFAIKLQGSRNYRAVFYTGFCETGTCVTMTNSSPHQLSFACDEASPIVSMR